MYRIDIDLFGKNFSSGSSFSKKVRGGFAQSVFGKDSPRSCLVIISVRWHSKWWRHGQVMQCLREQTGELDFLCVKTVDGRCAEIDFSTMSGVSFHMHRRPTYRSSTRIGLVVPDMSKLLMPVSGTPSEVGTGDHPSHADRCMPVTDVQAAQLCLLCVLM